MEKIQFCEGCQAPIIFIITVNKKRMPCQPEKKSFITPEGEMKRGYEPHWGYCPQAKDFKKEK